MGDRIFFGFLVEDAPKKILEEYSEEKIKTFIQKNADYYVNSWKKMKASNKKISWNWPSAIFGFLWMSYRKMFRMALVWFVMLGVLETLTLIGASMIGGKEFALGMGALFGISYALIMPILFGLFGNYVYASFVYEKFKELETIDPELSESSLLLEGGTSWGKVVLFIIASVVFGILNKAIQSSVFPYPPSGF